MEENGKLKIGLSTILLFFAIIVIIIMAIFMYNLYNEKNIESQRVDELNNKVENINIVDKRTFTDTEVKESIEKYFKIGGALNGSSYNLLNEIGFNVDMDIYDENERMYFQNTNIKFADFENKMLNYMSEKLFNEKFINNTQNDESLYSCFKNVDGMLYVKEILQNSLETRVESIEKVDINSYKCKVIIVDAEGLIDNTFDNYIGTEHEYTYSFSVSEYNGKCVIDSCEW